MNQVCNVEPGRESIDEVTPRAASAGVVLHVLDHSWPTLSGYSVRSRGLISAQRSLGQAILALTGPLHEIDDRDSRDIVLDGVSYVRTPIRGAGSQRRPCGDVGRESGNGKQFGSCAIASCN